MKIKPLLSFVLSAFVLLVAATPAYAANHEYQCDEIFSTGTGTCLGTTFHFVSDGIDFIDIGTGGDFTANDPAFPLTNGTPYYVYIKTVTGGNSGVGFAGSYYHGVGLNYDATDIAYATGEEFTFTSSNVTGSGFTFGEDSGISSPNFTGILDGVCISDVSYADAQSACGVGPPTPPSTFGTSPYQGSLIGTSTTAQQLNCVLDDNGQCAVQVVDNPTQDLFNGFILFFVVFAFIIWVFKKR